MLDHKEIAALRDRTFTLECPRITLTQLGVEQPRVLEGPGRISQDKKGAVEVTVYVGGTDLPTASLFPRTPLGTVLPDSDYFSLEAVDFFSRRWEASRVRVEESYSAPEQFSVARTRVESLDGWRDWGGEGRHPSHIHSLRISRDRIPLQPAIAGRTDAWTLALATGPTAAEWRGDANGCLRSCVEPTAPMA